jgi:hypothetical protein
MDATFGLLLAFDDESKKFASGFECGRIWALLRENAMAQDFDVHVENAEMMMRMAEATDRAFHAEEMKDGWVTVYFDYAGSA